MFAVIFEVCPHAERWDDYLALAKGLRPALEAIDGFVDNERFASRRRSGWVLSLSIWRDEKALVRWRTLEAHHFVQQQGRSAVFADYHLRVGEIATDSAAASALPSERLDETVAGAATAVTISELSPLAADADPARALGLPAGEAAGHDVFDSIANAGKTLLLVSWRDKAAAGWSPRPQPGIGLRHRRVRIIRDYGMFDRREAPQYYPAVTRRP